MKPRLSKKSLGALALIPLLALAFTWAGCSGPLPSGPALDGGTTSARHDAQPFGAQHVWYQVASQWVAPNTETTVRGGRYRLDFHRGSLAQGAQVTISEYDPNILEFQLGPDGTVFGTPVDLTIDYAGSNVDPLSPAWDGSLPLFLWLNPKTLLWEIVPGINNPLTRTYRVKLAHFSQYRLSTQKQGTAEW